MGFVAPVLACVLALYLLGSWVLYVRAFVPTRADVADDFIFTPVEFQADHEEVELNTADGVTFGAWYFRQPSSPQTVIVSPGHKGQRQRSLGIALALWRKGFNVIVYSYRGMAAATARRSHLASRRCLSCRR